MKSPDQTLLGMLVAVLAFGLAGTALELLFLDHHETLLQVAPLVLIGVCLTIIGWDVKAGTAWSLRAVRMTMLALIAAGLIGIGLHYRGNVEFQKEVDPSIHGFALFMKAMESKAPPALAPGILAYFGFLGLICTYMLSKRREHK